MFIIVAPSLKAPPFPFPRAHMLILQLPLSSRKRDKFPRICPSHILTIFAALRREGRQRQGARRGGQGCLRCECGAELLLMRLTCPQEKKSAEASEADEDDE